MFLSQLLLEHSGSEEGRRLVQVLSHRRSEVTLFVPHNSGFPQNQVTYGRSAAGMCREGREQVELMWM